MEITHKFLTTNGIKMHVAMAGEGPSCSYVTDFPNLGIRGDINCGHWQALATALSHLTCVAMAKPTNQKQLTITHCFT